MNKYCEIRCVEEKIDDIMEQHDCDPVDLCIYILEQYALEDGVKGRDPYQDTLGQAWNALRQAYFMKKGGY